MPYEVLKTVNGRVYRYSVRSERDPQTGKTRNRWTYLGRADARTPSPAPARRRGNLRDRLLDALERLLDRSDVAPVTADAISTEAGVAHGTFYRYFPNKAAAIRALVERLRDPRAAAALTLAPGATLVEARSVLRSWAQRLLRVPHEHRGALRAWYELVARDPEVAASKKLRRAELVATLAAFLAHCAQRGAPIADPPGTATALVVMVDGFFRDALAADDPDAEGRIVAAVDLIERGVFGALPESAPYAAVETAAGRAPR